LGFKPVELVHNNLSLYEFEVGFEQFLTHRTSILGGISYGAGNRYLLGYRGEGPYELDYRRYSIYTGLRSRLFTTGKFSLIGELQAGIRREKLDFDSRQVSTRGFTGVGLGVEYSISNRLKATFGLNSQYNGITGFETSFNLGLQFRMGKNK
jgi:hypothetical protein